MFSQVSVILSTVGGVGPYPYLGPDPYPSDQTPPGPDPLGPTSPR